MGSKRPEQVKRQGGISLLPALWDRIDEAAELAGVPRNRVMERALMEKFGMFEDNRKTGRNMPKIHEMDAPVELPE